MLHYAACIHYLRCAARRRVVAVAAAPAAATAAHIRRRGTRHGGPLRPVAEKLEEEDGPSPRQRLGPRLVILVRGDEEHGIVSRIQFGVSLSALAIGVGLREGLDV